MKRHFTAGHRTVKGEELQLLLNGIQPASVTE